MFLAGIAGKVVCSSLAQNKFYSAPVVAQFHKYLIKVISMQARNKNNYSVLDSKKFRLEKIHDLYKAEIEKLQKQVTECSGNKEKLDHYTLKKEALLHYLEKAKILTLSEDKMSESEDKVAAHPYTFAENIDDIKSSAVKQLRTDMEIDKEGINKKRNGSYLFQSTTLKQLTVTNTRVINILEAPEKIQQIYEAQIKFLLIKRNFYSKDSNEYKHYNTKYFSLLNHLSEANIIKFSESKSETNDFYTFNEDLTSVSISAIQTFQRKMENDKEGVNKRSFGFFLNSSTVNELAVANKDVIEILQTVDISHRLTRRLSES